MLFTHDTEVALQGAAALVNTMPGLVPGDPDVERLASVGDLDDFVASWGWTGLHAHSTDELEQVRALRPRLRTIWEADEGQVVDIVNGLLEEFRAMPQVVDHNGFGWHIHATPDDAPLAERMAVEAAMAFVDVLRAGELDRLRTCAADDCDDVIVDLSRNRSRRFCERGCGNRANVAAYRARQAESRDGDVDAADVAGGDPGSPDGTD